MQHLNYCRQAISDAEKGKFSFIVDDADVDQFIESGQPSFAMDQVRDAQKFILPRGGFIIEDESLRGLRSIDKLRLPFKTVALEYEFGDRAGNGATKGVVVAFESQKHGIEYITCFGMFYVEESKSWAMTPVRGFPAYTEDLFCDVDPTEVRSLHSSYWDNYLKNRGNIPLIEISHVLFHFLNAVACKNVHVEKSPANANKHGKKVKTALPFDDYHFLTVDVPGKAGVRTEGLGGSHRSPREHLRRGHIRRLETGPIWVNACVVNAGIGSKVGKSYLVRKAM